MIDPKRLGFYTTYQFMWRGGGEKLVSHTSMLIASYCILYSHVSLDRYSLPLSDPHGQQTIDRVVYKLVSGHLKPPKKLTYDKKCERVRCRQAVSFAELGSKWQREGRRRSPG